MFDLNNSFVISRNPYKYNILRTVFSQNNIPIPKIIYAERSLNDNIYNFIKKYAIPNNLDYFIMYEDDAWPKNDLSGLYKTLDYLSSNNFDGILSFGYIRLDFNPKDIIHNTEGNIIYSDKFIRMGGSQAYLVTRNNYEELCDTIRNKKRVYPYDNIEKLRRLISYATDITLSACKNIYFTEQSYFAQLDMSSKKWFGLWRNNFNEDTSVHFFRTWNVPAWHKFKDLEQLENKIFKSYPDFYHKLDFNNINKKDFLDPIFINPFKL